MQPPADHTVTYTGNRAEGNSTNHYGHNYNIHYHGKPDCNQCLRDLIITDPRNDKARIEKDKDGLLKQCYGWILEDANFQRWRAKGDARLLWIKGDPGKGKTMMTMGLIHELSSRNRSSNAISIKQIIKDHPAASIPSNVDLKDLDNVVNTVKTWLDYPHNVKWLLIYNNYNNPQLPGVEERSALDLYYFFPEFNYSSIIVIVRIAI